MALALHNAGALYLLSHPLAAGVLPPDAATEEELLQESCRHGVAGDEIAAIL